MGPAREEDLNLTVADLFRQGTCEWDTGKIRRMFPELEDKIKRLKPSLLGIPDKRVWLGTSTGDYSTKSGYKIARQLRSNDEEPQAQLTNFNWYKGVWNRKTAPKIKLMLWKVFQRGLPVGELLEARNIVTNTRCKRCGAVESINHLFLHCPYAQKVWEETPVSPAIRISGSLDLIDIWLSLCERNCLPPTGLAEGDLAPRIMWQLWISRNNLCFNNKVETEKDIVTKALKLAKEWNANQEKLNNPTAKKQSRMERPVCDSLRSDAAWSAINQQAGLGWVIRHQGSYSSGSKVARTVGSALLAEGLAMRMAITECRDLGVKRLTCESDCDKLISAVNGGVVPLELYAIVADIVDIASRFEFISFLWIPRGKNSEADLLAKQSLVRGDVFMTAT